MGVGRTWTKKEYEYLEEEWGKSSIPVIAKKLNRSVNAIRIKANRLRLGAVLESGDYVTLNQLMKALTGRNMDEYKRKSWIENRGMPIHRKKVNQNTFNVVYIEEFWEWAKKNRSFIDFSKMQPLALGKEPEWVREQRKKDFNACSLQRKDHWTPYEDDRLRHLLKQQKYGYAEIADMLCRSEGAIQRRCIDLGIKDRPVKADTHSEQAVWTDKMYEVLADGIRNGDHYKDIARMIGKSEKAVRGKVYTKYLTEKADKVREMLGNGKWGDNAPEPSVKQAIYISHTRKECLSGLSAIAGLLKYRMNSLGYSEYWQRNMCMKWDDYKGCIAGCKNCDECTEFERIKPQYCARCGDTFYERQNNRFCNSCRTARKKKAQRKWKREMNFKKGMII